MINKYLFASLICMFIGCFTANAQITFVGGSPQFITVCTGTGPANIETLLSVNDAGPGGSTLTWSVSSPALHGAVVASYSAVSPGGVITPVGMTYTPTIGYTGGDIFTIQVTDGIAIITTTINVSVSPSPVAGVITGPTSMCVGNVLGYTVGVPGGTWSTSNSLISESGGNVTGVAVGTSVLSYSVTNSCGTAVATKTITVSDVPFAGTITGSPTACIGTPALFLASVPGGLWGVTNANAIISGGGSLSGITPGLDTVTYTFTNTCGSSTATTTVMVTATGYAGEITGPTDVCVGSSIALTDIIPGGVWLSSTTDATVTSGGVVTGMAAGVVTIYYTTTLICGTATVSHTVTVNPLPDAGLITGSTGLCIGATTTFSDAIIGGIWSTAGTSSASVSGSGDVTGLSTGIATISYTVTNMCGSATTTKTIDVSPIPTAGTITGKTVVCQAANITMSNATAGGVWSVTNPLASISSAGVVTGITAGKDTILYTVTNSCSFATARKTVTVNPLPDPGTVTGAATVCAGGKTTMSNTTTGGVWSCKNANSTITTAGVLYGITPGTNIVSYTVTNSCGDTTATSPMTVAGGPSPAVVTGPSTVCLGKTVALSSVVFGGVWSNLKGKATISSSGSVFGASLGQDTLFYTISDVCGSATTRFPISVNAGGVCGELSAANLHLNAGTLNVFPNPNTGSFAIDYAALTDETVQIVITDVMGKVVHQFAITANKTHNVQMNQPPGIYVLSAATATDRKVVRVVIE